LSGRPARAGHHANAADGGPGPGTYTADAWRGYPDRRGYVRGTSQAWAAASGTACRRLTGTGRVAMLQARRSQAQAPCNHRDIPTTLQLSIRDIHPAEDEALGQLTVREYSTLDGIPTPLDQPRNYATLAITGRLH